MDYSVRDFLLALLAGAGSFGGLYWLTGEVEISIGVGLFCAVGVAMSLQMSRQYPNVVNKNSVSNWRGPVVPAGVFIAILSYLMAANLVETASVPATVALVGSFGLFSYVGGMWKSFELTETGTSSSETNSAVAPSDD